MRASSRPRIARISRFSKFYDLTERVIPEQYLDDERSDEEQVDWLCCKALDRLAFAVDGELQRFWEAADLKEVKHWSEKAAPGLVPVSVESASGDWLPMIAPADIEHRLATLPTPTSRLRIINPFDPIVRDRNRLKRLFGFDYRIEIFVPAAKRRYGYYVLPLLEGDRFVGRIEVRAERKDGRLDVIDLWPEPGIRFSTARMEKLEAELARLARFVGVSDVTWRHKNASTTNRRQGASDEILL